MARIVYQGQELTLPDAELQGEELLDALDVPPGRDLVVVRPGGNYLVNRRAKVHPREGDRFLDAPMFEYGATGRIV
jgi:hypothetical protein